jgi:hypothetical protein
MRKSQQTHLKSSSSMKGIVTMYVRNARTRELLFRYKHNNQIVYTGINTLIRLLAQNSITPEDYSIGILKVGTNARAPQRTDLDLVAPYHSMTLTDIDRLESLATGELIITKTLEASEGNAPTPLVEAGLFTVSGSLFARQIHPPVLKTVMITITYEWRLAFTA